MLDDGQQKVVLLVVLIAVAIGILVFRFYFGSRAKELSLPYKTRPLFSPTELKFFYALEKVFPHSQYLILAKVRMSDIFQVSGVRKEDYRKYDNRIRQKHVDFVIVSRAEMSLFCGIELDDSSHLQKKRIERDEFETALFQVAGLPLYRFSVKNFYNPQEIHAEIFKEQ